MEGNQSCYSNITHQSTTSVMLARADSTVPTQYKAHKPYFFGYSKPNLYLNYHNLI